jgi:Protein of unknown function (DUF3300)
MKTLAKCISFLLAAVFATAALAQSPQPRAIFSQPELDQMLAPIALYPDALLSQILMAATYPRDVAEAASWSRYQGGLRGDDAVRAAEDRDWDPSVVSLVAFPQLLALMDERRGWTERLGDAFVSQPDEVMDTVQELRRRADETGSLRSTEQMVVQRQGDDYVIDPPTPDTVYVPYYDPRVAFGPWWDPDYAPVWWSPWPSYGIDVGPGFFFGTFDWPRRYLRYAVHRPWYFHGRDFRGGTQWTHRTDRRPVARDPSWRTVQHDRAPRAQDARVDRRDLRTPDRRAAALAFERRAQVQAQAPAPAAAPPGFFRPRRDSANTLADATGVAPRNAGVRAAAPVYGLEGARPQGRQQREVGVPQYRQQREVAAPQYRQQREVAAPQYRPPSEAMAPQMHAAPVNSPVERAASSRASDAAQQASPVERAAAGGRGRDR